MTGMLRRFAILFSAGALGGLVNSVALWALGRLGVTAALGVSLAPRLVPMWLYPRIVWGGLWASLFLFPILRRSPFKRGFLYSLGPTAVQLLVVFPQKAHKGMFGLDLGTLTPLFVILLNLVWGITAAYFLEYIGEE
ncbi:MAG: hypothetical protein JSV26_01385 [bacterium]|nr:MAG: hypothetical protein JSV26_01385 [bacterium]